MSFLEGLKEGKDRCEWTEECRLTEEIDGSLYGGPFEEGGQIPVWWQCRGRRTSWDPGRTN